MELEPTESQQSPPPLNRPLVAVMLISLIFGLVGGVAGTWYAAKSSNLRKYFSATTLPTIQQGIYQEESAVINVVEQASPAVVSIVISRDLSRVPGFGFNPFSPFFGLPPSNPTQPNIQQVGAGTGFFVTSDGMIVTNRHVVSDEQASYSVVTQAGQSYEAQVLARDPVNDLAIIKIEIRDAPTLPLADSNQIQVGQQVVAIGNSLGQYQNTVTTGIVSGIGRSITAGGSDGSEQLEGVIQTDAAINPGNSGGPLLNLAAQVIGINTAVDREGQLVGFAIPASDARRAVESFQKLGRITRPFLGIRYMILTKSLAAEQNLPRDYGALILRGSSTAAAVLPGSPADRGGLAENDIILELNGTRITPENTLTRQLKNYNVGDTVSLKVYHQGEEKIVNLTLAEAPQ